MAVLMNKKHKIDIFRIGEIAARAHGSGIDETWYISDSPNFYVASNEYHVMNQNGFYVGWLPFQVFANKVTGQAERVHIPKRNKRTMEKENIDEGGVLLVYLDDLDDYILDTWNTFATEVVEDLDTDKTWVKID